LDLILLLLTGNFQRFVDQIPALF